jgi:hypothetical protein
MLSRRIIKPGAVGDLDAPHDRSIPFSLYRRSANRILISIFELTQLSIFEVPQLPWGRVIFYVGDPHLFHYRRLGDPGKKLAK